MPNPENIKGHEFTSENQPPGERKSRRGIPNRATVFKRLLKLKVDVDNPAKPDEKMSVPIYEAAALGQLLSAIKGNHNAWKEIQDTLHGKQSDKLEHSNPDGSALLDPLARALDKVYGGGGDNI